MAIAIQGDNIRLAQETLANVLGFLEEQSDPAVYRAWVRPADPQHVDRVLNNRPHEVKIS